MVRNSKYDVCFSKAESDACKLKEEMKLANEKTLQHNLNELANQMLFLQSLHLLYESKTLKNAC